MSHEGIRAVSGEEAGRIDKEEKQSELPREATEPEHVRVNKTSGDGMEIDWKDGHKSKWSFRWLRDACPCAYCNRIRESEGRQPGEPHVQPPTAVRIYRPPLQVQSVEQVGNYAIGFHWNDGHRTGIYSWTYLRRHCQCPECHPPSAPAGA